MGDFVTGKIKWWHDGKGYGFITAEDGQDVFCHYSDIQGTGRKTLVEGQQVEFEVRSTEKGSRAVAIVPGAVVPDGNQ